METIGAFEAKTHLASLLNRVAKGEKITITMKAWSALRFRRTTLGSYLRSALDHHVSADLRRPQKRRS